MAGRPQPDAATARWARCARRTGRDRAPLDPARFFQRQHLPQDRGTRQAQGRLQLPGVAALGPGLRQRLQQPEIDEAQAVQQPQFLVEAMAVEGAQDVSDFGGWRKAVTALK